VRAKYPNHATLLSKYYEITILKPIFSIRNNLLRYGGRFVGFYALQWWWIRKKTNQVLMNFNIMHVTFGLKNNRMKKTGLVLLVLAMIAFAGACSKRFIKDPVEYTIVTQYDSILRDVYIPNTGTYEMSLEVKFLTGYHSDKVLVTMSQMPARVSVTPDTVDEIPTYIQTYKFTSAGAALGTYPVTVTAYTPTQGFRTYTFNVIVIPADCAALLFGSLNGSNACSLTNYTYASTGQSTGIKNKLNINNFGGYGPEATAYVLLDCTNATLTMPSQRIGNGSTIEGTGTFTPNGLIINYTAVSTPGGPADVCTATYTKN
jgi:hypothetical protein